MTCPIDTRDYLDRTFSGTVMMWVCNVVISECACLKLKSNVKVEVGSQKSEVGSRSRFGNNIYFFYYIEWIDGIYGYIRADLFVQLLSV